MQQLNQLRKIDAQLLLQTLKCHVMYLQIYEALSQSVAALERGNVPTSFPGLKSWERGWKCTTAKVSWEMYFYLRKLQA